MQEEEEEEEERVLHGESGETLSLQLLQEEERSEAARVANFSPRQLYPGSSRCAIMCLAPNRTSTEVSGRAPRFLPRRGWALAPWPWGECGCKAVPLAVHRVPYGHGDTPIPRRCRWLAPLYHCW